MRWAWLAAFVAAIAIGVILEDVPDGSGSGPRLGIAYVRGDGASVPQVWLAGADGRGGRRLGPGTQPLLSPSGSDVAASAVGRSGAALVVYRADGAAHGYFDASRDTASPQAWSPDSRYLAVVLTSTNPLNDAASGLAVVDTESSTYRIVARGPIYGASFAPDGSDRIAYAAAATTALSAPVDVHVTGPDGTGSGSITHDGRSLYPVWGNRSIAFTHERLRRSAAPAYQVWTMNPDGTNQVALTHLRVPALIDGLVPISFAGNGAWLLAEYEGQNTSQAWAISVAGRSAHELEIAGQGVSGAALSHNGATALVNLGGYLTPPDQGSIDALPLLGGGPRLLVPHGAQPSWNQ